MSTLEGSGKIIKDGLVLFLDAANTRSYSGSGVNWMDLTSNNNNGTLTNGPTFNSSNCGSFSFDNTNDYVNVPHSNSLSITDRLTIESWIYLNTTTNSVNIIVTKQPSNIADSNYPGNYELRTNGGGVDFLYQVNTTNTDYRIYYNNSPIIQSSTWTHVCCVAGGDTNGVSLYINGVSYSLATDQKSGDIVAVNTNSVLIGTRRDNLSYFNGKIASVRIYNRLLSQNEVIHNYNVHKKRFGL